MVDLTFILGNLHRFVRERRKPTPPAPARTAPRSAEDRAFLRRTLIAAALLIAAIGVLWTML